MKKTEPFMINRPLADMHADGVRFDERITEALRNSRAGNHDETENRLNAG